MIACIRTDSCVLYDVSGVRDYIHVVDLALGHLAALNKLNEKCGCKVRLFHSIVYEAKTLK